MSILEKLKAGVETDGAETTEALAAELALELPDDCALALHGDLGAGKTTFVRGLARAWKITGPVASPSYNILALYRGERLLLHLDAYRLQEEAQLETLMVEDFLVSPYCLAVEWPEKTGHWLPPHSMRLQFEMLSPLRRKITLLQPELSV